MLVTALLLSAIGDNVVCSWQQPTKNYFRIMLNGYSLNRTKWASKLKFKNQLNLDKIVEITGKINIRDEQNPVILLENLISFADIISLS